MKPFLRIKTTLLVCLVLASSILTVRGQSQASVLAGVQERLAQQDWLTADLNLDDRPFARIRSSVDSRIRRGEKPVALEREFRLQGHDIYEPEKIFRWAYAAYREDKIHPTPNLMLDVQEAMNHNLRPGAYDWVRLRFLLGSRQTFLRPTAQLIEVGRRLLDVRYNDEAVMFFHIRNLQASESREEVKQSLSLARREARKRPRDGYWQWLAADSVSKVVELGKAFPSYRDNQWAIAEYKKALQLLPFRDPNRQNLIWGIVYKQMLYDEHGKFRHHVTRAVIDEAVKTTTLR